MYHFFMSQVFSIGFYNLENLFDPNDHEATLDRDYTPEGRFNWTTEKYLQKIDHLAMAISKIGSRRSEVPPILLGVCEVEQESCLNDLVRSKHLKEFDYGYVFHRSVDPRGMHVAFLFQKKYFNLDMYQPYAVSFQGASEIEPSRDILYVRGRIFGDLMHLFINHWPSRTDGTNKTHPKRKNASALLQQIIQGLEQGKKKPKIILMGDFNDEPSSKNVQIYKSEEFINPMEEFQNQKKGSVKYKGKWIMLDQILFNKNLMETAWFNFKDAHIFITPFLIQKSGRHKGAPKRTFNGKYHQGGFSDHFPVFLYFSTT